jgi:quinol monooxygenase YgiN
MTAGVVTMVSARVAPARVSELTGLFSAAVRAGMPERHQTSLLRGDDHRWLLLTVWRSRAELDAYLSSTAEPFALRLFRRVGAEPEVAVFDVMVDSGAPWWP